MDQLNIRRYFSFLLALLPLSFIAGNMIININVILIIISSFVFFQFKIFKIKIYLLDKLLLIFFSFTLITALINDYNLYHIVGDWRGHFQTLIKSTLFLRYLIFYFVIRFLIEKEIINLKLFFFLCTFSSLFVAFDIFYQSIYGKDVFGFVPQGRKLSGPFGDELIAGSFLQRFSLFSFFLLPIFFKEMNLNKYNKYIIVILFLIFFTGLILSGNRMPTLIFLLSIFLIVLFQKQTRKYFIPFIIIFSITFLVLFKNNEIVRHNFLNLQGQIINSSLVIKKNLFDDKSKNQLEEVSSIGHTQYLREFSTFYQTWLMNKYIGGGIKNFRYYCHVRPGLEKNTKFVCNMHPHNYYLEVLTETGIIGFMLILCIFFNIIYISFIKKYFQNSALNNNNLIIPFIFLTLVEIFPLKSTGSFFTTTNSTYLFLIIGLMIGILRKYNSIEKKE